MKLFEKEIIIKKELGTFADFVYLGYNRYRLFGIKILDSYIFGSASVSSIEGCKSKIERLNYKPEEVKYGE